MSSVISTSPLDIWAGKSRNAKAQARHRAKRKAYIEQLEQTVSKLQTALALSAEDVSNLPTTHIKLRELKEENDSLRAELRKLQLQQAADFSVSSVIPPQNFVASDEFRRYSKRRRLPWDDGLDDPRYTYLDSVGSDTEPIPKPVPPLSISVQNRGYHLQGPGGMTAPEPSQQTPSPLRDEPPAWTSYIPTSPQADSSWSYSGGHTRNRSTSSSASSASSDAAATPYLNSLDPNLGSYNISPPFQVRPIGKHERDVPETFSIYDFNNRASAKRSEVDINTTALNISANSSWPDVQVWP